MCDGVIVGGRELIWTLKLETVNLNEPKDVLSAEQLARLLQKHLDGAKCMHMSNGKGCGSGRAVGGGHNVV